MARLPRAGSDDWERQKGLSEFQVAIDEAAYFKNPRPLAKFLRSDYEPTKANRVMLADFVEGRLKRRPGAPNGKRWSFRNDWFSRGGWLYDATMRRWHAMKGKQIKFRRRDGRMVTIRDELCRRIASKLGHPDKVDMLKDYVNRAQSRR
jgi:hypothetical protein